MNVYCGIEVSVYDETTATAECSFSQFKVVFDRATSRTGLRSGQPLVELDNLFAHLLCHMLENVEEIKEAEIADLPAPEPLHGFDIELLKAHHVIFFAQSVGKPPVVFSALVGNTSMHTGKIDSCTLAVVAALLLARKPLAGSFDLTRITRKEQRRLYLCAIAGSQVCLDLTRFGCCCRIGREGSVLGKTAVCSLNTSSVWTECGIRQQHRFGGYLMSS